MIDFGRDLYSTCTYLCPTAREGWYISIKIFFFSMSPFWKLVTGAQVMVPKEDDGKIQSQTAISKKGKKMTLKVIKTKNTRRVKQKNMRMRKKT